MDSSTPLRTSPRRTSRSNNEVLESPAMDQLLGTFSGMKLQSDVTSPTESDRSGQESNLILKIQLPKRPIEHSTIEGSPVTPASWKRPDINPTPLPPKIPILSDAESKPFEDTARISSHNKISKLLVISSSSDEHNTGDHQENSLRTALLCGDNGCLRRSELTEDIIWLDSSGICAPPLVDLLRVHDYNYLRHLERKSAGESKFPPFYAPIGMLDTDTPLLPHSLEAAKRFCG